MISVLGGSGGFGFFLVLEVGCGADGSDQTQIRTILSSEVASSSTAVVADLAASFSITHCQPRCVVPHAMPISLPCSPQLAANLSQSSYGCEIWDGAVDLRFGMPMGLRFMVVGSGVVLWIWWQF